MTAPISRPQRSYLAALKLSPAPVLRAEPNAVLDGAIYDGPASLQGINDYGQRLTTIKAAHQQESDTKSKIISFKIQELELKIQEKT